MLIYSQPGFVWNFKKAHDKKIVWHSPYPEIDSTRKIMNNPHRTYIREANQYLIDLCTSV